MFRVTKDTSSGSLIQYLVKITVMDLSCPFVSVDMDYVHVHVNGHDRTIILIVLI